MGTSERGQYIRRQGHNKSVTGAHRRRMSTGTSSRGIVPLVRDLARELARELVGERDIQTGRKLDVVPLNFRHRRGRIGVKNISKRVLPAQPLIHFGDRSYVDCAAVLTGVAEVGVKQEALRNDRALPELMREGITQRQGRQALGIGVGGRWWERAGDASEALMR